MVQLLAGLPETVARRMAPQRTLVYRRPDVMQDPLERGGKTNKSEGGVAPAATAREAMPH